MRTARALVPLLLGAALSAAAQQPPAGEAPPVDTFGEVIDVRVINLEVVVTDRDGQRVHGLRRSDFRLLEDEREVPMDYFTEVRQGQAIVAPASNAKLEAPVPSLAEGGVVGTSYLVFIDDLFSLRARRDEVLRGLAADLARLGPEDRMAIVAFDGRRLASLSSWTGSRDELARALEQAAARRAYGIQRAAELASMEASRRMSDQPLRRAWPELDFDQLAYARQLNDRIERAVMAVVSAMRAFARAPGRKVLLLLAGGWPDAPVAYAANSLEPIWDSRLPWNRELYSPLTDTANRLGFTIYPVDVPGLESASPDATAAPPTLTSTPAQPGMREATIHRALDAIAAGTGGRPLINESRRAALGTAHADTRSYYWLGFTPARRANDQRHRVHVQVLREGLTARSRGSVLDLSRGSEITMMLEHTLLFGGGVDTAKMGIELGQPARTGRKEMELPISLTIPLASFTTLPVGGKWVADLELRVGAMDERGDRSDIPVIPLHLPFDRQPPAAGGHVRYDTRLVLRRIEQHLVLALFDSLSGKITTAEVDVAP